MLAAVGLVERDLFDRRNGDTDGLERRRIEAVYRYVDELGETLYEVVRFTPKDFRQRRPDGRGGHIWSLGDTRRVLYRLPEVVAAVAAGHTVFVVEGEKDVEALEAAGYVATCSPAGAGKWSKVPDASSVLTGADVIVVADRDPAGYAHARTVARSLIGSAASILVAEPAIGNDVAEHLGTGRTVDELVVIAGTGVDDPPLAEWLTDDDVTVIATSVAPPRHVDPDTGEIIGVKTQSQFHLPASFWEQRPQLAHIRQAAQAAMVSPDATLVNVLARIATTIPACYKLPAVIGDEATFDLIGSIVADTSGGKSAANGVSRRLLPPPDPGDDDNNPIMFDAPIGSGEGIAQFFMIPEKKPNEDGKLKLTGRQVVGRQALHLVIDEGTAFVAQTQRRGTTIIGTLASAWSGSPLGALNADKETRRVISGGKVRVCVVINMQAVNGYKLFAEELESVGFTGRIVFASAHDPTAPPVDALPDWPGPINWTAPPGFTVGTVELTYDDEIVQEIRRTRHGVLTGAVVVDKRRSQYGLLRCKVAGLFALWDERHHINVEDWELAGQLLDTSTAVLDHLAKLHATHEATQRTTRAQLRGQAEAISESEQERHAIAEMAQRILNRIPAGNEGVGRADLRRAVANSKTRHRFDPAVDRLVADGYVTLDEGRIRRTKP